MGRLTTVGVRGIFLLTVAAGIVISGVEFLPASIYYNIVLVGLPVSLLSIAVATDEADTLSDRRSPEPGTLQVGSDDEALGSAGVAEDIRAEALSSGSSRDWFYASSLLLIVSTAAFVYDYTGTTLGFLTGFLFVLMIALDQA